MTVDSRKQVDHLTQQANKTLADLAKVKGLFVGETKSVMKAVQKLGSEVEQANGTAQEAKRDVVKSTAQVYRDIEKVQHSIQQKTADTQLSLD